MIHYVWRNTFTTVSVDGWMTTIPYESGIFLTLAKILWAIGSSETLLYNDSWLWESEIDPLIRSFLKGMTIHSSSHFTIGSIRCKVGFLLGNGHQFTDQLWWAVSGGSCGFRRLLPKKQLFGKCLEINMFLFSASLFHWMNLRMI